MLVPSDIVKDFVAPPQEFVASFDGPMARVGDDWLATFDDATLLDLVDEALRHNPDLHRAGAVRDQARAALRLSRSALLPRLSGIGELERDQDSDGFRDVMEAELEVSWELDLWGRRRATAQASERDLLATELEYEYLRQSLAALVARAWFTAIVAREQVAIDQDRLTSQSATAQASARRAEAGVGTPLDADFALANVATAREQLAASEYAFEEAVRALELLLGRYPSTELAIAPSLSELPPAPPVGVPASLLERRPDLVAAEQRVAAAFLRTEARKLARLPDVTIGASFGTTLNPASEIWSLVADIFAPLFTGGEITAQIEIASAQQRQAMAEYVRLALRAFNEAESALAAARYLDRRAMELRIAVDRLASANRIGQERYDAGVLTIFELNQLRQNYFGARSQHMVVQLERFRRRIDLHLALGGSFEARPIEAPQPVPTPSTETDQGGTP